MADGRVAKLTISPGIGCTVYHNESGKALSATFFSNTISTDANSKMTVVVASAATVLTKQEVLWQPSYCLRCYSGFFTCKSECCAYPDPTKMAAAYTCGIFQSNIGTGQSGTPGMNKCLHTCWCSDYTPRRSCTWPGCYRGSLPCCWCACNWCCYSQRFTDLNCCATGGARFTRPSMAMVAAGTTYSGFVDPNVNTPDVMVYNCIGVAANCPGYTFLWAGCMYGCGNGCAHEGRKFGHLCACCVPVIWGGTEVINPAIAFTNPPLYNGTYSGFTTSTGGCWKCDCFQGPMWASQITGVFPGFRAHRHMAAGLMRCGCTTCWCNCCRGWCCCGAGAPGNAHGGSTRTGSCTDGQVYNSYFWTRCNTPNMNDAMRRVVSPYDDVGIGGTGIPFCYCNGSAPAFSNQQGGQPCNLQASRNYIGDGYDTACECIQSGAYCSCVDQYGSTNWMVDWYALTAYCNWCHCDICVGRWTKHTSSSDPQNQICCECWCGWLQYCEQGMTAYCCQLYQSCGRAAPMFTFDAWHTIGGWPSICICPCSTCCGKYKICSGPQAQGWQCIGTCGCEGINQAAYTADRLAGLRHFHGITWPTSGCCCNSGVGGYCCRLCGSAYSNCTNKCGPCNVGICDYMQPYRGNRCNQYHFGIHSFSGSGDTFYGHMSPYGVHHAYSNGIVAHWARGVDTCNTGNGGNYKSGYSFVIPRFTDFNGMCQYPGAPICCGITPIFMQVPCASVHAYCDADIDGGQANAPIKSATENCTGAKVCCVTRDGDGNLVCTIQPNVIKQWVCEATNGGWRELQMKYFAYNPFDDCHYFMLRTDEFTFGGSCNFDCADMNCVRKYHESGNTQQKSAFLPDMKTCLLTNNWMCGIFSINCQALNEYQRNNRCYCVCCGESCHCCADQQRLMMCYDGGTKFPEYKDYSCWGNTWCIGKTIQCGGCLCCICQCMAYNTQICTMYCVFKQVTPCWGLKFCTCHDCFFTAGDQVEVTNCSQQYRNFAGLGTVFFRKVGNFPSIMTDYKYTQPMMCVGCLFRSDTKLWSLPVYNHCEYRWDTFLSCDLKEWNQQEFVKCNIPADQMAAVCDCCVLNLTENYLCRCTDCFMSGFQREGLVELCLSFNQYERTGIVLSENDRIYVKNNDDAATGKCINFQVWGYEG